MSFGNISKAEQDIPIRLGQKIIKPKSEAKHMGLILASDPKAELETYKKRADDLKSVTFAARSLGSKSVPVVPSVINKTYEGVALPKCLYMV